MLRRIRTCLASRPLARAVDTCIPRYYATLPRSVGQPATASQSPSLDKRLGLLAQLSRIPSQHALKEMQNVVQDMTADKALGSGSLTRAYNTLLSAYCRQQDFESAFKTLQAMLAAQIDVNDVSLRILPDALARSEHALQSMERYLNILSKARIPLKAELRKRIISAISRHCDLETLKSVTCLFRDHGYASGTADFNALIKVHLRQDDMTGALEIWSDMERLDIAKDKTTFVLMLSAARASNMLDLRNSFYAEFKSRPDLSDTAATLLAMDFSPTEALEKLKSQHEHIPPRDLNMLIVASLQDDDAATCARLVESIRQLPTHHALSTHDLVITAQIKSGNLPGAMRYYRDMLRKGTVMDGEIYHTLIQANMEAGQPKQAAKLLTSMSDAGITPDRKWLLALLSSLGKGPSLVPELQVLDAVAHTVKSSEHSQDTQIIHRIQSLYQQASAPPPPSTELKTPPSLDSDFSQPRRPKVTDQQVAALTASIDYHLWKNDLNNAKQAYRTMQKQRVRPPRHTIHNLLRAFANAGQASDFASTWYDMRIGKVTPNGQTIDIMTQGSKRLGQQELLASVYAVQREQQKEKRERVEKRNRYDETS